ncbi:MAG: hypothetical protein JWN46_72 [Acidimicrobiales bacterium]|nr:hypothetical protein [Acidimicrobiales bacterium]
MSEDHDETDEDGREAEQAAIAMLTLRLAHPVGEWMAEDESLLFEIWSAGEAKDGGEGLLLSMMNLAWSAFLELEQSASPRRTAAEWLQLLVSEGLDVEGPESPNA